MTLNLHSYQEDNQLEKFERIADKIVEMDVDVVCFCEASQRIDRTYLNDLIREDNAIKLICDHVNQKTQDHYQFYWDFSHYGFRIYEEGIGILSRKKVKNIETRFISSTTDPFNFKSRKIMKAVIEGKKEDINLFSVHLGWGADECESYYGQLDRLDHWVQEDKQSYNLIAGDFSNDFATEYYDAIVHKNYIDQYIQAKPEGSRDYTFINPSGFEFRNSSKVRIDYVFSTNDKYKAVDAKRFFLEEDRVSDHAAVYVEIANL